MQNGAGQQRVGVWLELLDPVELRGGVGNARCLSLLLHLEITLLGTADVLCAVVACSHHYLCLPVLPGGEVLYLLPWVSHLNLSMPWLSHLQNGYKHVLQRKDAKRGL